VRCSQKADVGLWTLTGAVAWCGQTRESWTWRSWECDDAGLEGRAGPARGGRAERARQARSLSGTRSASAAAEASGGTAAEGAAEASPEALSYPPSARAGGDAVLVNAPAPGEVRGH
jgi:hypothetical protein